MQDSGLGAPVLGGVLGVQAGLDGVAGGLGGCQRQGRTLGDAQLQGDEVESEDGFGDGVFHLEAGVHLQEVRPPVGGDEELDGTRALVGDRAGGGDGGLVEGGAQGLGECRCRGLLDDLLVTALEGAVAGAECPDGSVGVGEDLDLDVAAALDVGLGEDLAVAEGGGRLGGGRLHLLLEGVEVAYDAHAASAAARGGLEEKGQVGGGGSSRVDGVEERDPGGAHQLLGPGLGGHRLDGFGRRADPGESGGGDVAGEACVLGQESVAGVDGVRACGEGGLDDQVAAQVGVGGGGAGQAHGRVGLPYVQGVGVGVGVDGDGGQAQGAGGAEDADRDLTAVGDQEEVRFVMCGLTSGRRRSRRGRPRRGRCGRPTGTGRGRYGCRAGR